MAYQFKLEQVRHLREQERRQAQWKYVEALRKLEDAEKRLSEALIKETEVAQFSAAHNERSRSVQSIQDYQHYMDSMNLMTRQCQTRRDRMQQKAQVEQSELQERRVSEQILNKLRQADYANYCLEEKRKDQGLMDEIVVSRYGRNG